MRRHGFAFPILFVILLMLLPSPIMGETTDSAPGGGSGAILFVTLPATLKDPHATTAPTTASGARGIPVTTTDSFGALQLGSVPSGASVYVDGTLQGSTPVLLRTLSTGSHTIVLKMNGYQDYPKTVAIATGGVLQETWMLVPVTTVPTTTVPVSRQFVTTTQTTPFTGVTRIPVVTTTTSGQQIILKDPVLLDNVKKSVPTGNPGLGQMFISGHSGGAASVQPNFVNSVVGYFTHMVGSAGDKIVELGSCGVKTQCYNPDTQKNFCTDLSADDWNCGSCGNHCQTDQKCVGGVCSCWGIQPDDCGEGVCTNTTTDVQNCGSCSNTCQGTPLGGGSAECSNGKCVINTCTNGLLYCYGSCINPKTDNNNCGGCGGQVCKPGTKCINGWCNDFMNDYQNCGKAGLSCTDANATCCSGTCVDTITDTANCGDCGNTCPPGKVCRLGACADPKLPVAIKQIDRFPRYELLEDAKFSKIFPTDEKNMFVGYITEHDDRGDVPQDCYDYQILKPIENQVFHFNKGGHDGLKNVFTDQYAMTPEIWDEMMDDDYYKWGIDYYYPEGTTLYSIPFDYDETRKRCGGAEYWRIWLDIDTHSYHKPVLNSTLTLHLKTYADNFHQAPPGKYIQTIDTVYALKQEYPVEEIYYNAAEDRYRRYTIQKIADVYIGNISPYGGYSGKNRVGGLSNRAYYDDTHRILTLDMTPLVNEWIENDSNAGIVLTGIEKFYYDRDSQNCAASYHSRCYLTTRNPDNRPPTKYSLGQYDYVSWTIEE